MKKTKRFFTPFISLLLIVLTVFNIPAFAVTKVQGDVDGNGKVEAADARIALRISVHLEDLTSEIKTVADLDKDNEITAADARKILRISVGLDSFGNPYFEVHFIDVGQADSALIKCNDETMLIDGGNVADSSLVVSYLMKAGVKELDYVVCTHAHEDHVGGLNGPLNKFTVTKAIYAPHTGSDSKCYNDFLKATARQGKHIETPVVGSTFSLGEAEVKVLGPVTENYSDINNTSIVLKVTYGETSFLFTGDAEDEAEQDILNTNADLSANVLKVGHHGSNSSTKYHFLREIMPDIAVISCGKDNKYGHPDADTLSRLRDAGVKIYRTDMQGNIIISSDGKNLTVRTEKNQDINTNPEDPEIPSGIYIGNINTMKFHKSTCSKLPAEHNRVYFNSRQEAINAGYTPCKICKP